MLIAEYSYEEDMQVKQEEALQIAQKAACTVEEVKDVRKMFSI